MNQPKTFPQQDQKQPGDQHKMDPQPVVIRDSYKGSEKLKGKNALITGGDSGIGQSVAVHFAREGANIAIIYLEEDEDALETKKLIEAEGQECFLLEGDIKDPEFCKKAVKHVVTEFGGLDILINNAAVQFPKDSIQDISIDQLKETFETNIYPYFYILKEALHHLKENSTIVNTTSVTSYRGSSHLLDYASTKGAITSFTRSLSSMLVSKGIRVNAVAPGPIWTPLIPATFEDVTKFPQRLG